MGQPVYELLGGKYGKFSPYTHPDQSGWYGKIGGNESLKRLKQLSIQGNSAQVRSVSTSRLPDDRIQDIYLVK
ncbi:MAG: hypothetical protein CM1200mP39_19140 [Dehalococcoidia bacterium]|nr:MAG: hypothetical protein CM1200mP39_19140 [Dehalococcoidia bacterium]